MRLTRSTLVLACCLLPALSIAATRQVFYTTLSGSNESPPNVSPGAGTALLTYTPNDGSLHVHTAFSGLTSGTTAAHVHCCVVAPATTAGVATMTPTFTGFPSGVTAGTYDHTFDMTNTASWNATFLTAHTDVTGAIAALLAGMSDGTAYFDIHTTMFSGGEIRGDLHLDSVFIDDFE